MYVDFNVPKRIHAGPCVHISGTVSFFHRKYRISAISASAFPFRNRFDTNSSRICITTSRNVRFASQQL